jgi:hypothetical protein
MARIRIFYNENGVSGTDEITIKGHYADDDVLMQFYDQYTEQYPKRRIKNVAVLGD